MQHACAQNVQFDSLTKAFANYRTNALQEKIYLHSDQNLYLVGESIWFKTYCVDGAFHRPLDLSKVAYVEIIDKSNTPVLQTKIALSGGFGHGSIFIPATIQSGNYKVRCYTHWMKNFPAEFFFEKSVMVVNPFVVNTPENRNSTGTEVQFFPEGGYLIDGIECKVAFKISSDLLATSFKGVVINREHDTIATFKPLKFGLGNFTMTPKEGEKYEAILLHGDGKRSTHLLPEVRTRGYSMRLTETGKKVTIAVNGKLNDAETHCVYLIAHARNIAYKAEIKTLSSGNATFSIESDLIPEGVSHFTIFDDRQMPVCERLFFKQPSKKLELQVMSDQTTYGTRQRVQINVSSGGVLETGNLSISVHKTDSLSKSSSTNIYNYLWILSDLAGKVDSVEYYFSATSGAFKEAADNLMLTHGWRRFRWENVLSGSLSLKFLPEYRGHLITAKVIDGRNVFTYLSIPGKPPKLFPGRANVGGEVTFEVDELFGSRKLVLQTENGSSEIELQNPFSSEFSTTSPKPFKLPNHSKRALLSRTVAMQVQDVYNEDTERQRPVVVDNDTIPFYGTADEAYYLDAYTRFPIMEEVMREYVKGVLVRKNKDGFKFMVLDMNSNGIFKEDPTVLLDGVPLFDMAKIMAFDPRKVKKLDVLKKRFYRGPLVMHGVVSYTTYNGDLGGFELDPAVVTLNYEGLQAQREFFSPEYKTQKQFDNRMPDRRFLVYWNPEVITKNGKATLEFYTSDIKGTFQVMVEGLTSEGNAGSAMTTFSVK